MAPAHRAFLAHRAAWLDTARPDQIPPATGWTEFGAQCGRGFGKTRMGAEWLAEAAWLDPRRLPRAVVAATQSDVRLTCFEGKSGLLNILPPECVADYNRTDIIIYLEGGGLIRGYSAEKASRLRGPEHADAWCFVAGTQVATPAGPVGIETLRSGSRVLTRNGARRVLGNASRVADVGVVEFADGRKIVGTADHPVYALTGWTRLDQLRVGDEVCAISASSMAGTGGTDTGTATTSGRTRALFRSARSTFTAWCGRLSAALSQRGTTSTTPTVIGTTTGSRTSSAYRTARTRRSTCVTTLFRDSAGPASSLGRFAAWIAATTSCESARRARRAAMPASGEGASSAAQGRNASAASAEPLSAQGPAISALSVASTWRPVGRQRVYCLKVDGEPEYFANGILVHNCDEIGAAWGKDAEEVLDMIEFGLRLGDSPRLMWTSTPKPVPVVRRLTAPKPGRIVIHGSTYDNRLNLSDVFIEKVAQYEGTKLGRQELHGELLDPEEAGIIRRSQFNLWPHDKPLPPFEMIILSLDTAFTEKTLDKKGDPDPTACGCWGIFRHAGMTHIMLLDAWEDHLGIMDLMRRVKSEMRARYGGDEQSPIIRPLIGGSRLNTSGRAPDMLLIEDKGSGISLRQMLAESGIEAHAYNPGNADKLARLHIVSPLFANRRVWLVESGKNPGQPVSWAEPVVAQLCTFAGEGSIKHDDHVDQTTQALRVAMDTGLLSLVKSKPQLPEEIEREREGRKPRANPYAA
jgi:predicted phage terminase large subunit-like protein